MPSAKDSDTASSRADSKTKPVILIGDTSRHILNHLASLFELANFEVRTAATAQECIDVFRGIKERLDMMLLDGGIAGDEGVHVILSVRREKPEQKILVVVEAESARSKAMEVGADIAIMKPITAEAILQKVNDMLIQTESFMERKRAKFTKR